MNQAAISSSSGWARAPGRAGRPPGMGTPDLGFREFPERIEKLPGPAMLGTEPRKEVVER
ncbi:hypothetical protein Aca07nite_53410 [Actinoplanes capillaceus]|uniref:Uncharacterized protein n=1 Tax=Actinoplanes campanulatus TaxID=113559 RepID=A0ABQ3WP84_9ACTN|nr:hypothetical protein Aca07nite_53410 [Actinoplanes capillaceus]